MDHPLTDSELAALRDLLRKSRGEAVPFANIRDARALTSLGLAIRSREGWDITAAGVTLLSDGAGADVKFPNAIAPSDIEGAASGQPRLAAKLVERWGHLRTLLIGQLDAFQAGERQMRAHDVDVSALAIEELRKEIGEFDSLIAAEPGLVEATNEN